MHRFTRAIMIAAFTLFVSQPLAAEEPAHVTFAPAPPGTVVASQLAYLAGEAMHAQWRGVISKKAVGTGSGETFYQWYVSIYQLDNTTYRLRYQSPRDGGPLDKLSKASGASIWFPRQTAGIVGAAPLMGDAAEQLVVQTHQTGADCGMAGLTVFTFDPKSNKVVPAVTVQNACDLDAKLVKNGDGASLLLSGPYYSANAPLCCPTKPKASATLKYANGKWLETPNYYKLYPKAFPQI